MKNGNVVGGETKNGALDSDDVYRGVHYVRGGILVWLLHSYSNEIDYRSAL